jgi:hypothetical protein
MSRILTPDEPCLPPDFPPIGEVVECYVRCEINWPAALGGSKILYKTTLLRRIRSKENKQGWQWSHPEIETSHNHRVVTWRYITKQKKDP